MVVSMGKTEKKIEAIYLDNEGRLVIEIEGGYTLLFSREQTNNIKEVLNLKKGGEINGSSQKKNKNRKNH